MRRCWRAVVALALARADEVRFAAKVSSWWHSDVAPTFETLEAVARTHLRKKDYGAFQRATGTSVGELLAGLRDSDANATRDGVTLPHEALPVVMSTKKVVPHPLNARGLQALRALLAIRIMSDTVRDSAPPGDAVRYAEPLPPGSGIGFALLYAVASAANGEGARVALGTAGSHGGRVSVAW